MTRCKRNAALRLLRCVSVLAVRALKNIVDSFVSLHWAEVSGPTQERLLNYIQLLASTGETNEQLPTLGAAYLKEIVEPDRR